MFPSPTVLPQHSFVCAAVLFLVSACTTAPVSETTSPALCERDGISIRTDFPSAGQHICAPREDGFVLTVLPEPSLHGRINPSPWYAFSVEGPVGENVQLMLDYGSYTHRYAPVIQQSDESWRPLDKAQITELEDGHKAVLDLTLTSEALMVAGLPLVTTSKVDQWVNEIVAGYEVELVEYGRSAEGRKLTAMTCGSSEAEHLVVALTRQHPPEIAGSIAFQAFASEILTSYSDEVLANTRFLFFPMMNPDGVERGHWRHNTGAVDLNRDWFDASQPEVASAQTLILSEAEGRTVDAFLDFHSTWRTLVYFHPFDTPSADSSFPEALKAAMDAEFTPQPDWISSHNDGRGTSKNWALQTFNTPGMTIELGDFVSQDESRRVGELTAQVLQEVLSDP
ncbi:MAG: hypothetical protein CMK09_02785 [Ponticaulis sp.]|nr:hypothetical protein [Ponticaulis sp.]|tara:strand:- start:17661 stop:18848 length:1188 start_codon:yes stop_codon:yes gene_type:complete